MLKDCVNELKQVKNSLAVESPLIQTIDKRIVKFEEAIAEGKSKAAKEQHELDTDGNSSEKRESKTNVFEESKAEDLRKGAWATNNGSGSVPTQQQQQQQQQAGRHLKSAGFGVVFANRLGKFSKPSPPPAGSPRSRGPPPQMVGRRGAPRGIPRGVSQVMSRAAMPNGAIRGVPRGRPRPPPTPRQQWKQESPSPRSAV